MPLDTVAEALRTVRPEHAFAAHSTLPATAVAVKVAKVGEVPLPVTKAAAKKLVAQADRAPFGRRDQTLIDLKVRDTWQIPGRRLTVRWEEAAWQAALARVGEALGLGSSDGIEARLQDMLLYEPGQFFKAHQDSEKDDDMLGTLVVVLPSKPGYTGGASVVTHLGKKKTFRVKQRASEVELFAFFADCRHEVQPVKSGHRVVLTYRLHRRAGAKASLQRPASEAPEALLSAVQAYFETPLPPRSSWPETTQERPRRLLYLLDHQYTARGLAAANLKPVDAARVRALSAVAEALDCEILLALVDIHENWTCEDDSYRGHRWDRYRFDHDDDEEDRAADDHPGLLDLIDWELELHQWTALGPSEPEEVFGGVDEREVCHTLATEDLTPYKSEHEGYMGNWGSTVDRWYHRAAVVLWPRSMSFTIRAEASASWALGEVRRQLTSRGLDTARALTEQMLEDWPHTVPREEGAGFFTDALRLGADLGDPELAARLLGPFALERITLGAVPALGRLAETYGERWLRGVLEVWCPSPRGHRVRSVAKLPEVCARLRDHGIVRSANLVLAHEQDVLQSGIRARLRARPLFGADDELEEHVPWVLEVLDAAVTLGAFEVTDAVVQALLPDEAPPSPAALVGLLRRAAAQYPDPDLALLGLAPVYGACVDRLSQELEAGPRAPDDWSLPAPPPEGGRYHWGRDRGVEEDLVRFLVASDQRRLEWPLRKELRQEVHQILDRNRYPVAHVTRRQGRPFVLVLEKSGAVHRRDAERRAQARRDLEWMHQIEPRLIP